RLFTPDEERGGARVAVLSYGLWQRLFGGDPHILGKALSLTGGVYSVVGVLPHDVVYPPWVDEQLYAPIATVAATDRALTQRGFHADCRIIGRLKRGITLEQAQADLDGVARAEAATYPEFNADWTSVRLVPLRERYCPGWTRCGLTAGSSPSPSVSRSSRRWPPGSSPPCERRAPI